MVLRDDAEGGASLYYEPHADYLPESVRRAVAKGGPVDVVVSPPCSQSLLGYPLVRRGCRAGLRRTVAAWQQRFGARWLHAECGLQPASVLAPSPAQPGCCARLTPLLPALPCPQVKGATDSLDLLRLLRPKVFVPLMNAEIDQAGPLAELLVEEGSVEELQRQLAAQPDLAAVRVALPTPAQPMAVVL